VRANLKQAYPLIVKGLINANKGNNAHWNATVNTITSNVLRTYMELNKEMFESISSSIQ
jgi:flagellin-specific chaperone FliS